MQLHTVQYYTLADVCRESGLDYQAVIEAIQDSDVSFGTNADTFITAAMLRVILDGERLAIGDQEDDVLISLGS